MEIKEKEPLKTKYKYGQVFKINHEFYGIQKIRIDDYIESTPHIYTVVLLDVKEENHWNIKTNGILRELNLDEDMLDKIILEVANE